MSSAGEEEEESTAADASPFEQALREAHSHMLNAHVAAIGTWEAELQRMRAENTMLRIRLSKASATSDQSTECSFDQASATAVPNTGITTRKNPSLEETFLQGTLVYEQPHVPIQGVQANATGYTGGVVPAPLAEGPRVLINSAEPCASSAFAGSARRAAAAQAPSASATGATGDVATAGVAVPLAALSVATTTTGVDAAREAEAEELPVAAAHGNTGMETKYRSSGDGIQPYVPPGPRVVSNVVLNPSDRCVSSGSAALAGRGPSDPGVSSGGALPRRANAVYAHSYS